MTEPLIQKLRQKYQIKLAISKLISPVDKVSEITEDGEYLTAVRNELVQLQDIAFPSSTDFPILLDTLLNKGLLTQVARDKLNSSYNIVTHYEPTLTGNGNQFNILSTAPKDDLSSVFTVTNTVEVDLNPGTNQFLQFSHTFGSGSSGTVEIINLETIRANLERDINANLAGSDYTATVSINGAQLNIAIILKATSSTPPKIPTQTQMSYTFDSEIKWTYPNDYSNNEYVQCSYSWSLNQSRTSGQLAAYIDKDQPLKQDLPELFSLFTILTSVADKLTTIYADPTQQDVVSFADYVISNPDKLFSELATPDSIYWLYDNVTDSKKFHKFLIHSTKIIRLTEIVCITIL
ncbi:hypothetical protein GQR36_16230 [Enterococcus termitis]